MFVRLLWRGTHSGCLPSCCQSVKNLAHMCVLDFSLCVFPPLFLCSVPDRTRKGRKIESRGKERQREKPSETESRKRIFFFPPGLTTMVLVCRQFSVLAGSLPRLLAFTSYLYLALFLYPRRIKEANHVTRQCIHAWLLLLEKKKVERSPADPAATAQTLSRIPQVERLA